MLQEINGSWYWVNPEEYESPINPATEDYYFNIWQNRPQDFVDELGIKIGYPFTIPDSSWQQTICQNEYGKHLIGQEYAHKTYNAGLSQDNKSSQGYRHDAEDLGLNPFYFNMEDSHNIFINPFPKGVPVKVTSLNLSKPDRESSKDKGKCGNYVRLTAYFHEDTDKFWATISVSICHALYDSAFPDIKINSWVEHNQPICRVGCSGYSSVFGIHGHTVFKIGGKSQSFSPFYGKYNLMNNTSFFYNEKELLKLIDFPEPNKYSINNRHKLGKGYHYHTFFSVNGSDLTHLHKINSGRINHYDLYILTDDTENEVTRIDMYENPFGLIPPKFNWLKPNEWQVWFNHRYNKQPEGNNLLDYCQNIKQSKEKILCYYKDVEGNVFPKNREVGNPQYLYVHKISFDCESREVHKSVDFGVYTYVPYFKGKRCQKFNLILSG